MQLAKRALGAGRVVAVCSGANAALVTALGADDVVECAVAPPPPSIRFAPPNCAYVPLSLILS